MQTTSHILMVRPVGFGFNDQTAVNNAFQQTGAEANAQEKALQEFDAFVDLLRSHGIDVLVVNDTPAPHTPDSIFPNNWISFHENGSVVLYPMFAANRRQERKPHVLEALRAQFDVRNTIDLSHYEKEQAFLEGTGSMVLDRENRIAYACLSPRTDYFTLTAFCDKMNYSPLTFDGIDEQGRPIYHTNVMMCVADRYAVVCMDAIAATHEKDEVSESLLKTGKELISISFSQMNHFAGNMLQVQNQRGEQFLVMSTAAYDSLQPDQISQLTSYNAIVHAPLTSIETNGGGSARCMMAEVFLPLKRPLTAQ